MTTTRSTPWPEPEADPFALALAERCGRLQSERDQLLTGLRDLMANVGQSDAWDRARALLARIDGGDK